MKRLLSLLLTLSLLLYSCPAAAELGAVGEPITYVDYAAALNTLTTEYLGWEMAWDETAAASGFICGNMRMSPVLVLDGEYVAVVYVTFTISNDDDVATLANLFLIVCTLSAAAPAIAQGADMDATVDGIYGEMSAMVGSLSPQNPTMMRLVGGNTCGMTITEVENGLELSMFLTYQTPAE